LARDGRVRSVGTHASREGLPGFRAGVLLDVSGRPEGTGDWRRFATIGDAKDLKALAKLDIVVSCQGGSYTEDVHPRLRAEGFKGYWIDAASTLRMRPESIIVLDPVNRRIIDEGLRSGIKDYIGGNCTVSLMLMGSVASSGTAWWSG